VKSDTETSYHARMLRVLLHIQAHLDEALPLEDLAHVAHFSPHHFHRVFRGMTGESVQKHVRRLRLERAAHRLKFSDQPVTQIAFEAGYEAHEAFTRVFRTMFDDSPTGFRENRKPVVLEEAASGVHYLPEGELASFESVDYGEPKMNVNIKRLDPVRVVFARHVGPYDEVGGTWGMLYTWAGPRGLLGASTVAFGVAYDDPDVTPADRLRYDACIAVEKKIEPEGEVALQLVAGGDYAVARHVGPYTDFPRTYARLFGEWLVQSGREARSAPALEFYLNNPMNTPPEKLMTDIHIPLEDKS
jgi:AraC family transcriptional regulator